MLVCGGVRERKTGPVIARREWEGRREEERGGEVSE
jgi:hypothetical protein